MVCQFGSNNQSSSYTDSEYHLERTTGNPAFHVGCLEVFTKIHLRRGQTEEKNNTKQYFNSQLITGIKEGFSYQQLCLDKDNAHKLNFCHVPSFPFQYENEHVLN